MLYFVYRMIHGSWNIRHLGRIACTINLQIYTTNSLNMLRPKVFDILDDTTCVLKILLFLHLIIESFVFEKNFFILTPLKMSFGCILVVPFFS